jgi:peptide chain release factor 1
MASRSSFDDKLDRLTVRHAELRDSLGRPVDPADFAKLSKELADLTPIV